MRRPALIVARREAAELLLGPRGLAWLLTRAAVRRRWLLRLGTPAHRQETT
jgi:hypothetical protein